MLKIKDNVDLKELEKFGFEYNYEEEYDDDGEYFYDWYEWWNRFKEIKIRVGINSKEICIISYCNDIDNETLNCIFDLIQAGLVKKVEG